MNNTPINAATPPFGDSIVSIDISQFQGYSNSGKLEVTGLYVSSGMSGAPAPVTYANPVPVVLASGNAIVGKVNVLSGDIIPVSILSGIISVPVTSGSVQVSGILGVSGNVSILSGQLAISSGLVGILSGNVAAQVSGSIIVSGNVGVSGSTQILSGSAIIGQIASGSSPIGSVSINSGQINIASGLLGILSGSVGAQVSGAVTVSGNVGVSGSARLLSGGNWIGVVDSVYSPVPPSPASGQAVPLQADASGNLLVSLVNPTGGGGGGSSQVSGAVSVSGIVGVSGSVSILSGQLAISSGLVGILSGSIAATVSGSVIVSGNVGVSGSTQILSGSAIIGILGSGGFTLGSVLLNSGLISILSGSIGAQVSGAVNVSGNVGVSGSTQILSGSAIVGLLASGGFPIGTVQVTSGLVGIGSLPPRSSGLMGILSGQISILSGNIGAQVSGTVQVSGNVGVLSGQNQPQVGWFTPYAPVNIFDTFQDNNGTAIASHTMNRGPGWTLLQGNPQIFFNKIETATVQGTASASSDVGTPDVDVSIDWNIGANDTVNGHRGGVITRASDASNYVYVTLAGDGTLTVAKRIAGSDTLVSSTNTGALTIGNTYTIKASWNGNTLTATANGSTVTNFISFNQTVTKHGFRIETQDANDVFLQNWQVNVRSAIGSLTSGSATIGVTAGVYSPVAPSAVSGQAIPLQVNSGGGLIVAAHQVSGALQISGNVGVSGSTQILSGSAIIGQLGSGGFTIGSVVFNSGLIGVLSGNINASVSGIVGVSGQVGILSGLIGVSSGYVTVISGAQSILSGSAVMGQINIQPGTSGGLAVFRAYSGLTYTGTAVRVQSGAFQLFGLRYINQAQSGLFLKLYDSTTAPSVGTDTPIFTYGVGVNEQAPITLPPGDIGIQINKGLWLNTTGGFSDQDQTSTSGVSGLVAVWAFYRSGF